VNTPANKHIKASDTKSVSKTLEILSNYDETNPMLKTSDIASKLNMNISTASRHLNTMLDWGFLKRDDSTGYYSPGYEIISLAGIALLNNDVYRYSNPELQRLSYRYTVHSHMAVQRGVEIVHLISSSCENTMDLFIPMGHKQPMYCSAMGRAILAYLPEDNAMEILMKSKFSKLATETKIDIEDIKQELIKTRQKGYCVLINELVQNKASLAAPIFNRQRFPVAAISVSTSAHGMRNPQRERELAKAVKGAADRISGKLGYFPL
jgi:DNA-binding IclR family transcriptional regulator